MGRTFLYCPNKGGNYEDFAHSTAVPFNNSYAVDKNNAYVVPMWAREAGVPIPVTSEAANMLQNQNVPGKIVPVPAVPQAKKIERDNPGLFDSVNFNSVASLLTRILLNYMDARNRRNESWWQKLARVPVTALRSYARNSEWGEPVSKTAFLRMAAPVIGTIASSFMPGWGSLLTSGLRLMGNHFLGSGRRKPKGSNYKRGRFVFNNNTRQILGSRVSLTKDVKKISDETLKERAQDAKWRKIISSAFTSAIKTVAPAIGSGRLLLGRKLNLRKIKKMGGSASDKQHMAWVRSFIGKKSGKGLKGGKTIKARNRVATSKGITYYGAGKRRKRSRRGGKLRYYMHHGVHYPKPAKSGRGVKRGGKRGRKRKSTKRGRGLVSSGIYKKGMPGNYSGMPSEWYPND